MSAAQLESLFAPGKLFLFGEWAVLEGAEALITEAPAGQRGQLSLTPSPFTSATTFSYVAPELMTAPRRWEWRDGEWCQFGGPPDAFDLVGKTLQVASAEFGEPPCDVALEVVTESLFYTLATGAQVKLGFGSSGSVCALVSSALARACDFSDSAKVLRVALRGHRKAQRGRGSGADVATSVFRGIIRYQLEEAPGLSAWGVPSLTPQVRAVSGRDDLNLFAIWTGRSADTRALMTAMREFKERARGSYDEAMACVAQASSAGIEAWGGDELSHLMVAVRSAEASLRVLGERADVDIVTTEHDMIAEKARTFLGSRCALKPSGAGGGDMTLLFVESDGTSQDHGPLTRLFSELEAKGCVILRVPLLLG